MENKKFDPVQLEIMWNRFITILEEQAKTLIRTSFSSILSDSEDLSAGLFDTKGNMIAQAKTGVPGHINSMAIGVKYFIEAFRNKELYPGDVLIGNNPYEISGHVLDITIVTPMFYENRLIGYFASTCHVYDMGGVGFSADGRSTYEEGLHLPYLKYYEKGIRNEAIYEIIKENSRSAYEVLGDIQAQVTSQGVAIKSLNKMFKEFGINELESIGKEIMDRSEVTMKKVISEIPDGTYENTIVTDGVIEGKNITISTQVTIEGDKLSVEFDGTSPAIEDVGFNVCLNYTKAYALYGIKAVIARDVPNNEGSFRPIHINAPEGSILNAVHPYPTNLRHILGFFVPVCVLGALAKALPDKVPAEGATVSYAVQAFFNKGDTYCLSFTSGGTGARPNKDGLSVTHFPTNTMVTPVEIMESNAPILFYKKEMMQDTGGIGEFRGGLGQEMIIGTTSHDEWVFPTTFDRMIYPAKGMNGGGNGSLGMAYLNDSETLKAKARYTFGKDDIITIQTPGGGGYGNPHDRSKEAVLNDVKKGYVSVESARKDYGVKIELVDEEYYIVD